MHRGRTPFCQSLLAVYVVEGGHRIEITCRPARSDLVSSEQGRGTRSAPSITRCLSSIVQAVRSNSR
jgi:hypothetical protein